MASRRKFVKIGVAAPFIAGTGGVILLNGTADAIWPALVARFIIGGFIRSTVTRTVARTVVNQGARQVVRAGSRSAVRSGSTAATRSAASTAGQYGARKSIQGSAAAQFGLTAGVSVSVSPNVLAKAEEYNADAIWVNHGHVNNFEMEFVNDTEEQLQGNISLFVRNVEEDKTTNKFNGGLVIIPPAATFKYPFKISNLPYDGVIKLSALSAEFQLKSEPSGNIIVAKEDDIRFEE